MRLHAKPMSDLSLPPLNAPVLRTGDRASADPSQWAMPPAANAGESWPLGTSEPCAILGLNDKSFNARLAHFDASTGLASVFVPPARSPMQLRFGQFQRCCGASLPRLLDRVFGVTAAAKAGVGAVEVLASWLALAVGGSRGPARGWDEPVPVGARPGREAQAHEALPR